MSTNNTLHKDLVWEVVRTTVEQGLESNYIVDGGHSNGVIEMLSRTFNVMYNNHFVHPNLNMIGNKYNIDDVVFVIHDNQVVDTSIKAVNMTMRRDLGFTLSYELTGIEGEFMEGSLYDTYEELIEGLKVDWTNKHNRPKR